MLWGAFMAVIFICEFFSFLGHFAWRGKEMGVGEKGEGELG